MTVSISATIEVPSFSVRVECDIPTGTTVMTGPSGSGKSLTLAAIAGLIRPDSGTIVVDGRTVADPDNGVHVRSQARGIGMVFQTPSLLGHKSPLDNVAMAVLAGDRRERHARAAEWLDRVGARDLATKNTATLSGGEQQRVSLARALAGGCSVLLLDEPFSALDRDSRESLRSLVCRITREEALTSIMVTHDMADMTAMAERIVLFEPGRTIGLFEVDRTDPDSVAGIIASHRGP